MASSVQWASPHVLSLLSPHTSLHVHNIVHPISPLYPPGDSKQFSGRPRSASVPGPGAMGTRYSDILVQWHICNMLTYIPLQISQIQQSQPWLPGRNIILLWIFINDDIEGEDGFQRSSLLSQDCRGTFNIDSVRFIMFTSLHLTTDRLDREMGCRMRRLWCQPMSKLNLFPSWPQLD